MSSRTIRRLFRVRRFAMISMRRDAERRRPDTISARALTRMRAGRHSRVSMPLALMPPRDDGLRSRSTPYPLRRRLTPTPRELIYYFSLCHSLSIARFSTSLCLTAAARPIGRRRLVISDMMRCRSHVMRLPRLCASPSMRSHVCYRAGVSA